METKELPKPNLQSKIPKSSTPGSLSPKQNSKSHSPISPWFRKKLVNFNPFPRYNFSAITNNHDIYIFGGHNDLTLLNDLVSINSISLEGKVISVGGQVPSPRQGHSSVFIGKTMFVFGGESLDNSFDDHLYAFNITNKMWYKVPMNGNSLKGRRGHSVVAVSSTFFIFGGFVDNFYLHDMASFDVRTATSQGPHWKFIESQNSPPSGRAGHSATVYQNSIFIFGGTNGEVFFNDMWKYDIRNNTWALVKPKGSVPKGRAGHACTLINDCMYIMGGLAGENQQLNDFFVFKISTQRWYTLPSSSSGLQSSSQKLCAIKDRLFALGAVHEFHEDNSSIYMMDTSKLKIPSELPSKLKPPEAFKPSHRPSTSNPSINESEIESPSELPLSSPIDPDNLRIDTNLSNRQEPSQLSSASMSSPKSFSDELQASITQRINAASSLPEHRHHQRKQSNSSATLPVEPKAKARAPLLPDKPSNGSDKSEKLDRSESDLNGLERPPRSTARRQDRPSIPSSFKEGANNSSNDELASLNDRRTVRLSRSLQDLTKTFASVTEPTSAAFIKLARARSQGSLMNHSDPLLTRKESLTIEQLQETFLMESHVLKKSNQNPSSPEDFSKLQMYQTLVSLKKELSEAKTDLANISREAILRISEAEQSSNSALQEIVFLKAKLSAYEANDRRQVEDLDKSKIGELQTRLNQSVQKNLELTKQIETLQSQLEHNENLLRYQKSTSEELDRRLDQINQLRSPENTDSDQLVHQLTSHKEASEKQISQLNNLLSKNEIQIEALRDQVTSLQKSLEDTKQMLQTAMTTSEAATERATQSERLLLKAQNEILNLESENIELKNDIQEHSQALNRTISRAEDMEKLWKSAKQQLSSIHSFKELLTKVEAKDSFINDLEEQLRQADLRINELENSQTQSKTPTVVMDSPLFPDQQVGKEMKQRMLELENLYLTSQSELSSAQKELLDHKELLKRMQTKVHDQETLLSSRYDQMQLLRLKVSNIFSLLRDLLESSQIHKSQVNGHLAAQPFQSLQQLMTEVFQSLFINDSATPALSKSNSDLSAQFPLTPSSHYAPPQQNASGHSLTPHSDHELSHSSDPNL